MPRWLQPASLYSVSTTARVGHWGFRGLEVVPIDPHELAVQLLAGNLDDQPPETQRLMRYVWARVGLDYGILQLVGEDHVDGLDRLVCTLQEDGSCYIVERPPGWGLEDEAAYVEEVKAMLDEAGP